MKLKLVINGECKQIQITPENDSDKKLLEFVIEHNSASLTYEKAYNYGNHQLKSVTLTLKDKPKDHNND